MKDIDSIKYSDLKSYYSKYFSLGYLNTDINTKFALISLICYLVNKLKEKRPDVTYYQIIYKLGVDSVTEDFIKGLSIMCEDFAYGCKEFPTFGIKDKDIPLKIKEILKTYLPF